MAFSPTNSVYAPISVEHARKQCLSTNLDIRYKLSCSQALCAHVRADYARILYTMMHPGPKIRSRCLRRNLKIDLNDFRVDSGPQNRSQRLSWDLKIDLSNFRVDTGPQIDLSISVGTSK